jgi:hypothetical protein
LKKQPDSESTSYFFDRFKPKDKGKPLSRNLSVEGLSVYIESGKAVNLFSLAPAIVETNKKKATTEEKLEERYDANGKLIYVEVESEKSEKKEPVDEKKKQIDLETAMQKLNQDIINFKETEQSPTE